MQEAENSAPDSNESFNQNHVQQINVKEFKSLKEANMIKKDTTDSGDHSMLRALLREASVTRELDNLTQMALDSSYHAREGDIFDIQTLPFCDGVEIKIGHVSKADAPKSKAVLASELQNGVEELVVKNLLFSKRGNQSYIWLTLNPDIARLTPRMMNRFT